MGHQLRIPGVSWTRHDAGQALRRELMEEFTPGQPTPQQRPVHERLDEIEQRMAAVEELLDGFGEQVLALQVAVQREQKP